MLPWIVLYLDTSLVERFIAPLYSLCREVQTLTREDRDINGWLHFLRCIIFHRAVNRSCARHKYRDIAMKKTLNVLDKTVGALCIIVLIRRFSLGYDFENSQYVGIAVCQSVLNVLCLIITAWRLFVSRDNACHIDKNASKRTPNKT